MFFFIYNYGLLTFQGLLRHYSPSLFSLTYLGCPASGELGRGDGGEGEGGGVGEGVRGEKTHLYRHVGFYVTLAPHAVTHGKLQLVSEGGGEGEENNG